MLKAQVLMTLLKYFTTLVVFLLGIADAKSQDHDTLGKKEKKVADVGYIKRLDTLLHLQTWFSTSSFEYKLNYDSGFQMVLAPHQTNNISLGFSYRYLDLGVSFTPHFLNANQQQDKKGESERFSLGTSFSMYRFNLALNYSTVSGLYLKNSNDFINFNPPDSPYLIFPHLSVRNFNMMLRFNVNPNFSTATLTGGTQIQQRSALTFLPTFQFARFRFHDGSANQGLQNEYTYSSDINLLLPATGTLVVSPQFSASLGLGPSIGVDFFKSVAIDDSSKVVLSKGTKAITGFTMQASVSWHPGRFFAGVESRYRNYGHKIEDISRLIKQYFYFQIFIGWRIKAPRFAKKSLDWVNKISPVDLD
jgi:hypothetical protein